MDGLGSALGGMLTGLREGVEAALIIGIVAGYLVKIGRADRLVAVWAGVIAAVIVSAVAAVGSYLLLGGLDGAARTATEAIASLLAVCFLTYMLFWMRRQAQTMGTDLRDQIGVAIAGGGTLALATVAFVAVVREGFETALFLFVSVGESGAAATIIGGAIGFAVSIGLGVAFYRGSLKLDLRRFFLVTGLLVLALAAYLLYSGLAEIAELTDVSALEVIAPIATVVFLGAFGWAFLRNTATVTAAPSAPAAPPIS